MKRTITVFTILTVLCFGSAASADIWLELGDAGGLPGTAQVPFGMDPLTSIAGTITTDTDDDMYLICILDPLAFSATTAGTPGTLGDTQLFLFDAAGMGVVGNDDLGGTFRAIIPAFGTGGNVFGPTTPGLYYLAISGFDHDPAKAGLEIFPDTFPGVVGPTGPGGPGPIDGWVGSSPTGTYTIGLTGAVFAASHVVPEPGTIVLVGVGAVGLVGRMLRRRKLSV